MTVVFLDKYDKKKIVNDHKKYAGGGGVMIPNKVF